MYEIILICVSLGLFGSYKYQMKHGSSGTESDLFGALVFWVVAIVVAILDVIASIAWLWNHISFS